MSKLKVDAKLDRRGFLKGIGTGAAGAATVAAGAGISSLIASPLIEPKWGTAHVDQTPRVEVPQVQACPICSQRRLAA